MTFNNISDILYYYLDSVYCGNCRYNTELKTDVFNDRPCDECHRKSMFWGISKSECNDIARKILEQINN